MISDEERREVAHNIRENYICDGVGYKVASAYSIAIAIGMNPEILVGDIALWNRLADLIEPHEPYCIANVKIEDEELERVVKEAIGINREALLELADDLAYASANVENVAYIDQTFYDAARRIREAVNACEARPDAPVAVDDEQTDTDAYMDDSEAAEGYHIVDVSDKFNENIAAIDFVRDNGGLEAVKARLMPEGMEWPRFEDGELVRIWDTVPFDNGSHMTLHGVELLSDCFILHGVLPDGMSCQSVYLRGERVKHPKAIASDGEPLEPGQTVYATHYDYAKCTVLAIEWAVDGYLVEVENEGGHRFRQSPDEFTHQRPVLDADGVPIKVGDTVWHIETGREYVVIEPSYGETAVVRLAKYDDAEGEQYTPDQLTHTKPELPDSWERIEEDAGKDCCVYYGNVPWTSCNRCPAKGVEDCNATMARDLVRRAKKLAGDA